MCEILCFVVWIRWQQFINSRHTHTRRHTKKQITKQTFSIELYLPIHVHTDKMRRTHIYRNRHRMRYLHGLGTQMRPDQWNAHTHNSRLSRTRSSSVCCEHAAACFFYPFYNFDANACLIMWKISWLIIGYTYFDCVEKISDRCRMFAFVLTHSHLNPIQFILFTISSLPIHQISRRFLFFKVFMRSSAHFKNRHLPIGCFGKPWNITQM